MYQDWKHAKEDQRYYGVTVPYEDPKQPTPQPQALPTTQALPIEDFLPEFEVREPELAEPTVTQTTGQPALEIWALESQRIREGRDVPAIHRHANKVLRETQEEVTCPNCRMTFKP
jgi:hypothetical protein